MTTAIKDGLNADRTVSNVDDLLAAIQQKGRTAFPAKVADNAAIVPFYGAFGEQIVHHSLREMDGDATITITSSTAVQDFLAADALFMNDITGLVFANISAVGTEVTLYDDDGTTVRLTFYVPANDTRGIVFKQPLKQLAVNKKWKLKTVTSIASLKATICYTKTPAS